MSHYLSYIKDSVGNNYLGIKIYPEVVSPFLLKLQEILSEDYDEYTQNQQNRDRGSHHITVINAMDYNRLAKDKGVSNFVNSIEDLLKTPIDDLRMLGVGTAARNDNRTYFVVCRSERLDQIREMFGLPPFDFHITLGFKSKDVFGVRKNMILETNSKFIQLLKQEFYKKENFNFIKGIENYSLSQDLEIVPVSISETHINVLCGEYLMDIGCLDSSPDCNQFTMSDGDFYIFTKYKKTDENINRLPMTEIYRILDKKDKKN